MYLVNKKRTLGWELVCCL